MKTYRVIAPTLFWLSQTIINKQQTSLIPVLFMDAYMTGWSLKKHNTVWDVKQHHLIIS